MRKRLALLITVGALAVVWHVGHLAATVQQPDGDVSEPADSDIAVLDVARVFKEHALFKRQIAKLKQEVQNMDAEIRLRGQEVQRLQKQLEAATEGSPEQQRLQDQVIAQTGQLRADTEKYKAQLLQREALVYRQAYQQVVEEVQVYAKQRHIRLVVRHQGDSIDSTVAKKVLQNINRFVVFQDGLEITDAIIERLDARNEGKSS